MLDADEVVRLHALEPTYAEVGATAGALPAGYHQVDVRREVGRGEQRFHEAADAVLGWRMHRGAGIGVRASDEPVVEGTVAVLRIGFRWLGVDAPVRVLRLVDEEHRRGFAYATLPGHPERGEEEFVVEIDAAGAVSLRIRAFSLPATRLARAVGPLSTLAQRLVTARYTRAV